MLTFLSRPNRGSHAKPPLGFGVVTLVTTITILTNAPVFLPGAAGELISRDVGFGAARIGLIITFYWISSIFGAFVSRHTDDGGRVGHRIGIALLGTATGLIMAGFWPQVGLWVGGLVGGFVYGYTQPHTNFLLVGRCEPRIRGLAFGVKQAAIPLATLLFSVAVPIVAEPPGWRLLLIVVGMVCAVLGVALLDPGQSSDDTGRPQDTRSAPTPRTRLPLNRHLLGLAVAGACGAAVGNSLGGFLILSLVQSGGTLLTASLIASAGSITAIIVRIAFGVLVDRTTRTPGQLLSLLFVIGSVGTALLAIPTPASRAIGGLLAYGGGWGWAGLLHYEAGAAYPGNATPATAITQMGVSLGGATGPLSFGILLEAYGSELAWSVMTVVGSAAYLATVLARRALTTRPAPAEPLGGSLDQPVRHMAEGDQDQEEQGQDGRSRYRQRHLQQHRVEQVERVTDHPQVGEPAWEGPVPQRVHQGEERGGQQHRRGPARVVLREDRAAEDYDYDDQSGPPPYLPMFRAVKSRAREHDSEDDRTLPRPAPAAQEH